MKLFYRTLLAIALVAPIHAIALPPGAGSLASDAIELAAKRSGRVIAGKAEREAAEATLEASIARYGRTAASAAGDGGLELLEATRVHGMEVMEFAAKVSPAARRVLALEAGRMLPLARVVGPEALELEAKAPGMAQRALDTFGIEGTRTVAAKVPAQDIPRLVMYGEKATTPQARKLLLAAYLEEGGALFSRLRPATILAQGLSEAMILGGAAAIIAKVMPYLATILWALAALGVIGLVVAWLRQRRSGFIHPPRASSLMSASRE